MAMIPGFLRPTPEMTERDTRAGLRNMTWQAVAAAGADGLASGGFLAAFALILGATLGAMQAAQGTGIGAERLTEETIRGTFDALGKTGALPLDVLRGATYGVIRGASETNLQISAVTTHTIEAARNAASMLGLSAQEAARYAAQVAVEAAQDIGGRDEAEIKEAVLGELMGSSETDQKDGGE